MDLNWIVKLVTEHGLAAAILFIVLWVFVKPIFESYQKNIDQQTLNLTKQTEYLTKLNENCLTSNLKLQSIEKEVIVIRQDLDEIKDRL